LDYDPRQKKKKGLFVQLGLPLGGENELPPSEWGRETVPTKVEKGKRGQKRKRESDPQGRRNLGAHNVAADSRKERGANFFSSEHTGAHHPWKKIRVS